MGTGAQSAIETGLQAAEAVAETTGLYRIDSAKPPNDQRRRSDVVVWGIVFLLLGSGGTSLLGGLLGNDGAEALARVAALEADVRVLERDTTDTQRMLRDQARVLAWLVESSQRQTKALAAVAKAAGLEVDLAAPPLLPEIEK